jgi:hypothetical protein
MNTDRAGCRVADRRQIDVVVGLRLRLDRLDSSRLCSGGSSRLGGGGGGGGDAERGEQLGAEARRQRHRLERGVDEMHGDGKLDAAEPRVLIAIGQRPDARQIWRREARPAEQLARLIRYARRYKYTIHN